MAQKMNCKGQTTIFVIVAIAIVAIIGIVFFMFGGPSLIGGEEVQPNVFIGQCIEDGVEEALEIMLPQGGFINPKNNSLIYDNHRVEYVCYHKGYYEPCIMQHPAYLKEVENEIVDYIEPRLEDCFESLREDLESRNIDVELENKMDVNVEFVPNVIRINVNRKLETSSEEETQVIEDFDALITHPIYELINTGITIASQEARYCNFEYLGYELTYSKQHIKHEMLSDSSKIYAITDKATGEELVIAIRGCALPVGL